MVRRDPYLARIRPAQRLNGKTRPGWAESVLVPILVLGAVVAAFAGMYYLVASKQLLAVQRVVVLGADRLSPEQVRSVVGIHPGENVLRVNLDDARRRLESQAWIARTSVSRRLPSTVVVQVTERTPFALLELGQTYIVDRNGVVLQACTSCEALPFPRVIGFGEVDGCSPGTVVPGLSAMLHIVSMARTSDFFARFGLAALDASNPGDIRLLTERGGMEVRVGEGLTRTQLDDLDEVLPQLSESRRVASIDVTGNRRVIVKLM